MTMEKSTENSNIAVIETSDSYLMKVDLPSLPLFMGPIEGNRHSLTVRGGISETGYAPENFLSIQTLGDRVHTVYQDGTLYIVLPKSA